MLTRDAILAADDRRREEVAVPEWGGSVLVSTMSGADRDAFEASILLDGKPNLNNMRAKLVAACVVSDAGERIFTPLDIEALGRKSAAALERIVKVAQRLNGMTQADLEAIKGN